MAYGHGLTHTADKGTYWDTQSMYADTTRVVQDPANLGCSKIATQWSRTSPLTTREDVAVTTMSIAKIVGGGLYSVLSLTEMASVETALDTLYAALSTKISTAWSVTAYIWHEHRANHPATPKGYETIGPATRYTIKALPFTASASRQPDQVSATLTWRTTSRKHWGRIYVPGISANHNDTTYGRIINAQVDSIAGSYHTFESTLNAAGFQLGVWTWKYGAFLQLSEMRMDNVWDIQRRRRAKQSSYSRSYTS